ncbi:alkylated DNA repair protein ALKBH8 homolog [Rhodamnia argentea]|uniref:Alkylated DNA repair protein ALKBH8 homolog n=1 Tax=Rhodamnia argentea TaxID=178133 RepID=A0A8B8Q1E3_9MYRT|nr:alkylated DNA repair protein ALKBH8 homolog [Rhodamnia argentea]
MGLPRFGRPKGGGGGQPSPNLYVANCGPAVGISYDEIRSVFGGFGQVKGVYAADESGARVVVCFDGEVSARAALEALNGRPCSDLGGRSLHVRYSVERPVCQAKMNDSLPVHTYASELKIPGLYLLHDFISLGEEKELLGAVDDRPWNSLVKRRVQHYGYEFRYDTRNVDANRHLGELPSFVSFILERISSFPGLPCATNASLDQLTVNEYPVGVGLSPHIDTHSAFEDLIFSLSLAGPCIMEFRRYLEGGWLHKDVSGSDGNVDSLENTKFLRKAICLPPRSMLLLSAEARYAWHHYIPHHKIDIVMDKVIKRSSRRVSFTFRKVRTGPCRCEFPSYCDSQSKHA